MVYIYHIFFIYFSVYGHSGCFHVLPTVNSIAMNIRVSFQIMVFLCICAQAEKEMATHSNILTWRIPGTEEHGGLSSIGSHKVGHD